MVRVQERLSAVKERNRPWRCDERGAQLSQEYPPPVDQRMGSSGRKAQARKGGQLFQLVMVYGLSDSYPQNVSWGDLGKGRLPSVSGRLREYAPPLLGFHLGTTKAKDFRGVLYRLPFVVVFIGSEEIKHMAELMEKRDDLCL